ncbi:MAG: hypothetical protein ACNFW9_00275 [Candidatus Kerfeldbacteria bacterium]
MKSQPKQKRNKLLKQFPILVKILEQIYDSRDNDPGICIKVQRTDAETLFLWVKKDKNGNNEIFSDTIEPRPDNDNPERRGQRSSVKNSVVLAGSKNQIIKTVKWSPENSHSYIIDYLQGVDLDILDSIIWVQVQNWFKSPTNNMIEEGKYIGEFIDNKIEIVIYQKPKQGWKKLLNQTDLFSNVVFDVFDLAIQAWQNNEPRMVKLKDMIETLTNRFAQQVYTAGAKQIMIDHEKKRICSGLKAQFHDITLLVWTALGQYTIALIGSNGHFITFSGHDNYTNFEFRNIYGSFEELSHLVEMMISEWRKLSPKERKTRLIFDPEITKSSVTQCPF